VSATVSEWQSRPLDPLYPILYLDCIVLKIRQNQRVIKKSVYLALGVNLEGHKELLGMWLSETEGAKFWLSVLTELKSRGLQDMLIACVDGLKGFPEAIEAEYPHCRVQLCLVHMVRNVSLRRSTGFTAVVVTCIVPAPSFESVSNARFTNPCRDTRLLATPG